MHTFTWRVWSLCFDLLLSPCPCPRLLFKRVVSLQDFLPLHQFICCIFLFRFEFEFLQTVTKQPNQAGRQEGRADENTLTDGQTSKRQTSKSAGSKVGSNCVHGPFHTKVIVGYCSWPFVERNENQERLRNTLKCSLH